MKVYRVDPKDGEPALYFATQREAITFAKDAAHADGVQPDDTVDVERVTLVPLTKAAIVRLLNISGGYEDAMTVVKRFPTPTPNGGAS